MPKYNTDSQIKITNALFLSQGCKTVGRTRGLEGLAPLADTIDAMSAEVKKNISGKGVNTLTTHTHTNIRYTILKSYG